MPFKHNFHLMRLPDPFSTDFGIDFALILGPFCIPQASLGPPPRDPNMAPGWSQDGPKMASRWPQEGQVSMALSAAAHTAKGINI